MTNKEACDYCIFELMIKDGSFETIFTNHVI